MTGISYICQRPFQGAKNLLTTEYIRNLAHLSKTPSANIVNRMENLLRTVNIGKLKTNKQKNLGRIKFDSPKLVF